MTIHSVPADGRAMLSAFIKDKTEHTTRRKFAAEYGISEGHLSAILSGKKGISLDLAKRLSEITGIPPAKLHFGLAEFMPKEAAE